MDIAESVAVKVENAGDPRFARQCKDKVQHGTERDAKKQAKIMHKLHHKRFNAYKCPYCDGWHIGAQRSPAAAARRHS